MSPVIYTPPTPHGCKTPYVAREQPQIHLVPAHTEGTLWKCDVCGAVWRVEGRQSAKDRRAGLTALSTEWVRVVAGDESGGPSDDVLERALNGWFHDEPEGILEGYPDETTARMRAALTAALTPKENQS